jgi:hypothetical protein
MRRGGPEYGAVAAGALIAIASRKVRQGSSGTALPTRSYARLIVQRLTAWLSGKNLQPQGAHLLGMLTNDYYMQKRSLQDELDQSYTS